MPKIPVALEHKRLPTIVQVPIASISLREDVEIDEKLVGLEIKKRKGKIITGLTRIDEQEICTGFFKGGRYISDIRHESVSHMKRLVRSGGRPRVTLYSAYHPEIRRMVLFCSDDEHALAAYRELGIRLVPAEILGSMKCVKTEACIWFKVESNFGSLSRSDPAEQAYSVLKEFIDLNISDFSRSIEERVSVLSDAIRDFHSDAGYGIHFHQMLSAIARRAKRLSLTILLLATSENIEYAEALLRLLYESFLSFYIDWISPEFFGPRIQLMGMADFNRASGESAESGMILDEALGNLKGLLQKVQQKARISPFGEESYIKFYSVLSNVSHQSYNLVELEATSFDMKQDGQLDKRKESVMIWVKIILSSLIIRIENEIGIGRA